MSNLDERIIELEIKNAHLEDTIEQLNRVIVIHQQSLDDLRNHFELLRLQFISIQQAGKEAAETPPPHY